MKRPIVKIAKETPLIGRVINSFISDNKEENAPSIQAVIDNMTPPQSLTINSDFQINQRGQSEYNFSTNGKYGLDMWQHRQGEYVGALIVTPIKGGGVHVKLGISSGGGLRQILNDDDFKLGQQYTAVVSINGTRYEGTLNLLESARKIIDNDLFQVEIGIIDGKFNYSLWIKKQGFEGDINYCDLFPGSIAYQHQKEDYATALNKTLLYYRSYYLSMGITYKYSNKEVMALGNIPKMVSNPVVTVKDAFITDLTGNTNKFIESTNGYLTKDKYQARFKFERDIHTTVCTFFILIELSCESL